MAETVPTCTRERGLEGSGLCRPAEDTGALVVPDRVSGGRVPGVKTWLDSWPVYRQLTGSDPMGRGTAGRS
jgi:hypothetical protein